MGILGKRQWNTTEELECHYISVRLAQLEKEGYKFKYADPWGEWPEDYLNLVLNFDLCLNVLRQQQFFEATTENGQFKPSLPALTEVEIAKNLQRSKAFNLALAKRLSEENEVQNNRELGRSSNIATSG